MKLDDGGRAERLYARMLALFPSRFRELYGRDAVELFRDRHAAARSNGPGALVWLWLQTIPNVLFHGLLERMAEARARRSGSGGASVRGAVRALLRAPGVSAVIVLTLGVGIGANVALFSVLRGVLLRPLPYPAAERLVRVWETNSDVDDQLHGPSPWNFADWERASPGFESMAAWFLTSATYRADGWLEELRSARVTVDFFRTLGVRPMLGRDFVADEVTELSPLMLSHRSWQRLFGGDSAVVGQTVVASGRSHQIVGVMPRGFVFPDESVDVWVAWDLATEYADRPDARSWRFLDGMGRLAPGISIEQAEGELDAVARGLSVSYPAINGGWDTALTSLHEDTVGEVRATLWLAFGSVLFVLLIACANVANLLLARAPARSRELAIRTSLGATRRRVAADLLLENLVLGTVAAALGLALGKLLLALLVAFDAGRIPRLDDVGIDPVVLVFTVALAVATSVTFGLAPSLQALRAAPGSALGDGARTTDARGHRRLREGFVACQVAVALVLLTGAGLFSTSLGRLLAVDPGFDPGRLATFRVSLDGVGAGPGENVRYYEGLIERIDELPGVESAAATQTLPLDPVGNDFRRPYRPMGAGVAAADAPTVQMRIVTPGYVRTMGMTLLDGEEIPGTLVGDEPLVALVNRTLAERLWPGGGAVGASFEIDFREGWQSYRVLGVVQDVKAYGPRATAVPEAFLAHPQVPYLAMSLVVRTAGQPESMAEPLRRLVIAYPPMQPAYDFVTMDELVSASTAEERFLSLLLALLAAIALGLASTGVYAVIAYSVSHRRRELGIRMALGAEPEQLVGGVLGRAAAVACTGCAVGLALVLALARVLEGILFGVSATDPLTVTLVGGVLASVSALAAWLPARRAAWIPPSEALRPE